jgi:lysophospholipase L1-like esterase
MTMTNLGFLLAFAIATMTTTMDATAAAKFLALGDSYTIGEGVAEDERWPMQLARRLRADGVDIGDPTIVATTGWTTDELSAAMDATTFAPPYGLVTLLIGVNNQYRGRSVDDYRDEFGALLVRAMALAGAKPSHVVVVSIPDWGVTGFARESGRDRAAIAREIDAYNAAARDIATKRGVAFVDVTRISRDAGNADAMLVGDRLHPSAGQYEKWADAIDAAARQSLNTARD